MLKVLNIPLDISLYGVSASHQTDVISSNIYEQFHLRGSVWGRESPRFVEVYFSNFHIAFENAGQYS